MSFLKGKDQKKKKKKGERERDDPCDRAIKDILSKYYI